jgi:hypothetical protein
VVTANKKATHQLKTVWILGAGFSRGVGGPLLTQLLTESSAIDVALRFPEEKRLVGYVPNTVRRLFQSGLPTRSGSGPTLKGGDICGPLNLWRDAEEFLEYLDTAASDPSGPLCARLKLIIDELRGLGEEFAPSEEIVGALRDCARRIIAAECCSFLVGANTKSERWDPFHDWARQLRYRDTVITFNYDRVIESLDANHLKVSPPASDWEEHRAADVCRVLKLHGSVDWVRGKTTPRFTVHQSDPAFAVTADDDALALATPGPTKRSAAKEFAELWNLATDALREADVVVFVGYRFPPSDAEARSKLLGAIRGNRAASKHLRINIVLGPERTPDVIRLEQMLRAVGSLETRAEMQRGEAVQTETWLPGLLGSFDVTTHPMWAEDFFSVWSREMVEQPHNVAWVEQPSK